jgi:hypothetical protein
MNASPQPMQPSLNSEDIARQFGAKRKSAKPIPEQMREF